MENKKVIGVVQVLQHLKDGMTRNEIAAHYGITKSECKLVFMDDRLKGKKTIKKPTFTLVDDADAQVAAKVEVVDVVEVKETVQVVDDANDGGNELEDTKADDTVEDKVEETEEVAKSTWVD